MKKKKIRFVLCPELSDGHIKSIVTDKAIILETVGLWIDEVLKYGCRDGINIGLIEMTDEEVEGLPDI